MVSCASQLSILYKKERNENCWRNQRVGEKPGFWDTAFEGKIFPAPFTQRCKQWRGAGDDPIGTGPDSPRLGASFHHNFFKSECLSQSVGQSSWMAENSQWALFCSIQTYSLKRFAANPQDILEVAACGIDCCFNVVESFLFFIPWEIICHA